VDSYFIFADKFLPQSGAILFFHLDDLWILKQIKEFLDSYSMSIQMKWAMVNSLPLCSIEDLGLKVHLLSHILSLLFLLLVIFSTPQPFSLLTDFTQSGYTFGEDPPNFWISNTFLWHNQVRHQGCPWRCYVQLDR